MAELEIDLLPALSDNYVYLLYEPEESVSAVVDPAEAGPVLDWLDDRGRSVDWILSTHHHFDHTGGNAEIKERTGCRIAGPAADADRIPGIDVGLAEGDVFALGAAEAKVFETPGHTRGHISLWFADSRALFCADTLFALGCGRLFEGTPEQMWHSLEKLVALPGDTRVYCGHEYTLSNARFAVTVDPDNQELRRRLATIERLRDAGQPTVPSTLEEERRTNPFLRPDSVEIRRVLGMEGASDVDMFAEIRRRKDAF